MNGLNPRLILAAVIAVISLASYFFVTSTNPVTGEKERGINITPQQEIALGLSARNKMAARHGGLDPSPRDQSRVDRIGNELLTALDGWLKENGGTNPYRFEFHLLADKRTINAFALPGGQVFITRALYDQLDDAQLAGVLGHEIGHVLERHSAKRLAKEKLTQGLAGAAGVAAGDAHTHRMSQAVGRMITMKYGRDQELESDEWGIRLMGKAGYDPRAMLDVMKILANASGGGGPPEFLSTHPKPANRQEYIRSVIQKVYPHGIPKGLKR